MSKLIMAFNTHIVKHMEAACKEIPKYGPDKFQAPIISAVSKGKSVAGNAVAGSGKSSLITLAVQEIDPKEDTNVKTASSLGYGSLRNLKKYLKSIPQGEDWKYSNLASDACKKAFDNKADEMKARKQLKEIVVACMQCNIDMKSQEAIEGVIELFGIEYNYPQLLPMVEGIVGEGLRCIERDGYIGFIDMLYWPVALDLKMTQYDFVLADECQDFNALHIEILRKSIKDGGTSLAVGDPRQSMYGFMGALPDSFEKVSQAVNGEQMPLSFCYRCPSSHLDLARQIVPHIENSPFAKEGVVNNIRTEDLWRKVSPKSMILCRFTAPLVKECIYMIGKGIPAIVKGSDIGKSLTDIVDQCSTFEGGVNVSSFKDALADYFEVKYERLAGKKNSEMKIEAIQDSCDALRSCFDYFKPRDWKDFTSSIKSLFADKSNIVTLSTIHRSKGLEANDVFILNGGKSKLPVIFKNSLDWQVEQEHNIHYVALTRGKESLTFVETPESASDYSMADEAVSESVIKPFQLSEKPKAVRKRKSKTDKEIRHEIAIQDQLKEINLPRKTEEENKPTPDRHFY